MGTLQEPATRRGRLTARFKAAIGAAAIAAVILPGASAQDLAFHDIHALSRFDSAAVPGVFQLACAGRYDVLMQYFNSRRLTFEPNVVRHGVRRWCHIVYEPSLPGFRAHPESAPVSGVYVTLPHLRLLSPPGAPVGDGLDVVKAVLDQAPHGLDVTLVAAVTVPQRQLERAVSRHFPQTRHRLSILKNPDVDVNSWSQDFVKSGQRRGELRLLVPRRIFEGDRASGAKFKPLLDALSARHTARSRLSWEGGDLMFVRHPKHPDRTVMIYGDAARPYWAESLTDEEYAYVLRAEFGADESIYFGGIAPHADYVVSFLPEDHIALVAQPVGGDRELARAAARMLALTFSNPAPAMLVELEALLSNPKALALHERRIRELIDTGRRESKSWAVPVDGALYQRIQSYIDEHCAGDAAGCTSRAHLPGLLESQPELLAGWVHMAATLRAAELLPGAMLSVIERQLPGETAAIEDRLLRKVHELEAIGFRVIRAPWIGGEDEGEHPWAGISPVNMLLLGKHLFVPVFGLGPEEQKLVESFARRLPEGYTVRPVFARAALLQSGGVHCLMGAVREVEGG